MNDYSKKTIPQLRELRREFENMRLKSLSRLKISDANKAQKQIDKIDKELSTRDVR